MTDNGLTVPKWAGHRSRRALARVKHAGRNANTPCCLCSESIDYNLQYPNPMSCSVQHVKARALHPELTWQSSNWSPCHLVCNQRAGTGEVRPSERVEIGPTSGW